MSRKELQKHVAQLVKLITRKEFSFTPPNKQTIRRSVNKIYEEIGYDIKELEKITLLFRSSSNSSQ